MGMNFVKTLILFLLLNNMLELYDSCVSRCSKGVESKVFIDIILYYIV